MVAGPSDESFLPQLVGIFYAVFDPHRGPTVPYQVPETLISQPEEPTKPSTGNLTSTNLSKLAPTPPIGTPVRSISSSPHRAASRVSKRALSVSPSRTFRSRRSPSPLAQSTLSLPYNPTPLLNPALIDWSSISEYIIPKSHLKHRLITCCSGRYKILGFPCMIEDTYYERNEFIFNIAFVFDRLSDLSAFEPVVRKCGRIMRACELDNKWLSSSKTKHLIQSVLEQLHEDLNSYSETSIVLDGVNSLDLALFPFYPNPPEVHNWHVPVSLVDFKKLKDANWDITATKISQYIDGVNHVQEIAHLADADLDSVRLCIQHFLYYQVIMMIDIFQYSNMYTCKPAIQRKSKDRSVVEECGVYVTREGFPIPSWPVLAILYSQLRPGVTVHDWMEANEVQARGIDVRRFVTFGVIKGFLRRVHRWPIYVDMVTGRDKDDRRSRSNEKARIGDIDEEAEHEDDTRNVSGRPKTAQDARRKDSMLTNATAGTSGGSGQLGYGDSAITLRTTLSTGSLGTSPNFGGGIWRAKSNSPGTGGYMQIAPLTGRNGLTGTSKSPGIQTYQPMPPLSSSLRSTRGLGLISSSHQTNLSSTRGVASSNNSMQASLGGPGQRPPGVHRSSRDGRSRLGARTPGNPSQKEQETALHTSMVGYLDGLHHTDELQVKFKMGWAKLNAHLKKIAGVPDDPRNIPDEKQEAVARGDYGKIAIVLR